MKNMKNKPTHFLYSVTDSERNENGEKTGFWTKIGAAWPHSDGKGFSLAVDAIPLNGRLVLRERPKEEEERAAAEEVDAVAAAE